MRKTNRLNTFLFFLGDQRRHEGGDPRHRRVRREDQLREADGQAVDRRPQAAEHQLGKALPHQSTGHCSTL